MDPGRLPLPRAELTLKHGLDTIASVSAAVWTDTGRWTWTGGLARRSPPRPATPDQRYDLASLTKALAAAPVCAALADAGVVDVDAPLIEVLRGEPLDPRLTAWHLLCHTSGWPAWAPLYELALGPADGAAGPPSTASGAAIVDPNGARPQPAPSPAHAASTARPRPGSDAARDAILRAARATARVADPGAVHCYSDLGYLTLCAWLEAATGERINTLYERLVRRPLLGDAGPRYDGHGAAATERCPRRGEVVEGAVHDLNAWAMGGISSHAGLFGSAEDVAGLAWRLALDDAGGLRSVLQRWWDRAAPGTHRGGWDKRSTGGAYTATGARFPDDTVGHLGYTGCSVWVARSRRTVAVLLSNRVHEVDDLTAIRALRPAFHDAVAADLGWPDPEPG